MSLIALVAKECGETLFDETRLLSEYLSKSLTGGLYDLFLLVLLNLE
jgi:hypothetical protein